MGVSRDYDRPDHVSAKPSKTAVKETEKPVKGKKKKKKGMNGTFLFITYFTVFLFIGMMAYFAYFNAVKAESVISSSYNKRLSAFADRIVRGSIYSADGQVLASTSTDENGNTYRSYPYGAVFAHVVGYADEGSSGLELYSNFNLLSSHAFFAEKIKNDLTGEKNVGDNVITTLDTNLQQAAYNALGSSRGAVIAMDPQTGAIKAMVSKPDFDPNTITENWDALNADTNNESALLNRVMSGAYAPGSTFKIVTALSYIRQNADYTNYYYNCNGAITYENTTIECFNHNVHGEENLTTSFANSCNASFANIGLSLAIDQYEETAGDMLFNKNLPSCPIEARTSQFSLTSESPASEIMMTAMGQGKTLVSPYHMALIASAIANDGVLMKPYLVGSIENYTGSTVKETKASKYKTLMTSEEAEVLTQLMQAVVTEGTGRELSGQAYSVAGKTGTAEYSSDKNQAHSWFVGFSNVEDPDLVVCVIVEDYDSDSSARAVPVAKQVFDAYYNNQ